MTTPELKPCEMPVYDFESNWDTPFSKANERVQLVKKSDADAALATARAEVESAHLARELTLAAEIDRLNEMLQGFGGKCPTCLGERVIEFVAKGDGSVEFESEFEMGPCPACGGTGSGLFAEQTAEIARLKGEINVAFFACYGCGKLTDNWSEARDGRKYCEPCWHKMADAKGGTHAVIVDGERGEPT